ncbi:carbohydrate esterase family 4 protein [Thozetella sp. PMI_491]|nr:carbohydrate esterase family 4 protein [Thozetella sp. PMI_491]
MLSLYFLLTGLSFLADAAVIRHGPAKRELPYGTLVEHCNVPGTVALTFDDGPYQYTLHVLDLLDQYGANATFFVVGDNFGRGFLDDPSSPWPDVLRRMAGSGHQVGSHTWDHNVDLSQTDSSTRYDEMAKVEVALNNVLGYYPTYMRPPFGSCDAACQQDLGAMGYHVINFDVDTKDYENDSPDQIHVAIENFDAGVSGDPSSSSFIVLSHDVHENTAYTLAEYMLQSVQSRGFRAVTVGECLGDDASNWYRTTPSRSHG